MKNRKFKKRIAAFITAFVMVSNMMPLDEFRNVHFPKFNINIPQISIPSIKAEDNYSTQQSGWVDITSAESFSTYCSNYANDNNFAAEHENDKINLILSTDDTSVRGVMREELVGLGTAAHPFKGTIMLPDNGVIGGFTLSMYGPFFNYVMDSVKIVSNGTRTVENVTETEFETIAVFKHLSNVDQGTSKPLFAHHVVHDTSANAVSANWHVRLSGDNAYTYSGVIGEIGENANVKLTFENLKESNVESKASSNDSLYVDDVGIICGRMQTGSVLEVNYSETNGSYNITSSNGNAGGLVGKMLGNAALTINSMPTTSRNLKALQGYAGGLIGELSSENTITVTGNNVITVNSGEVIAQNGAGGLFGHYTNTASANNFDLAKYSVNTTAVYGGYCGGIFGVLENNKGSSATGYTITLTNTGSGNTLSAKYKKSGDSLGDGYFGGIAGRYITDDLKNSFIIDGISINAEAQSTFSGFGGAVGIVDSAAYIKTNNTVSVSAKGTALSDCFGGLIGKTSDNYGVFADIGNFTLTTNEQFKGGGIVGKFAKGVLRLSGTTTMTNAKPQKAANCGQLVGVNDSVLVYALINGSDNVWTFNRSKSAETDDLGTWGEVVRLSNIESNVLTFDTVGHTVTVAGAVTSIGTPTDFVKTALNIQLNQGQNYDCLLFTAGDANKRSTLLASTELKLTADLTGTNSLSGTGITGFMRDGGVVGNIGSFTGTFDGQNHKIDLYIGETYGVEGEDNQISGMGQICYHCHNGLFAILAGTVKNLNVGGTINIRNCVNGMNIGGIASRNGGGVTLTNVSAYETINYHEDTNVTGSEAEGKNIGGLIGFVGTNGTININGVSSVTAAINFSGYHNNWNSCGGAIGKVTAGTFEIKIGSVGDSNNILTIGVNENISSVTSVGEDSNSGGLIGRINSGSSYANRKVTINNLVFNNCTIGNAASKYGGGFLGYTWLDTTTTIDGLTVTSGTINNSISAGTANNVGAMCYCATGKWIVNALNVTAMTMSNGCGESLGMIVNKAYYTSNNTTKGLYLDVLDAGYRLTGTGITLPASLGVYDEIAAYSASDVISGGGGVISINMNSARTAKSAKITTTGTYQNQLTIASLNEITSAKYANPNARYYYNLDVMDKKNSGQNLVLWSVKKYSAGNISGEFVPAANPFGTTGSDSAANADLTGLSFYPIASADEDITIGNINLKFDYNGLYATAEGIFNSINPTDSYIRDPADANQHYLMHSGLFINQPMGNSLTISGKMSLEGAPVRCKQYSAVKIRIR